MEISINRGGSTKSIEYGYFQQQRVSYTVIVSATEAGSQPLVAIQRAVEAQPTFADLAEMESVVDSQLLGGGYKFTVTGTQVNAARRLDNFTYTYSSGLSSETRGTDIYGHLNTVQYPGDTGGGVITGDLQTALVDVTTPQIDIIATGLRDLTPDTDNTDQALLLQGVWLNTVNSVAWRGCPPRSAKCVAVECKPHYVSPTQNVHLITFRFSIIPSASGAINGIWSGAHDPWIYWQDNAGKVPGDDQYTYGGATDYNVSYRQTHQYPGLDYNTTFPLGEVVP